METMRCTVTGAAGFMGSHLTDYLIDQGHEVVGVDNFQGGYERNVNPDAEFIEGDLRNERVSEQATQDTDILYHLAAYAAEGQSVFSFDMINDINIGSTNKLLTAAINNGVDKTVFTSSMAVYGDAPTPMDEEMPRDPEDPYGWGKAYCEGVLESCHEAFDHDYTIIRPHNVYGPRQNMADSSRNVIAIFMNRAMKGQPPIIYGDGEQTRAFSYVDDITPPIARAGWRDEATGEIINVGSDEVHSVNSLADIILDVVDNEGMEPRHDPPRPNEVKHAHCTVAKSEELLDYETNHTLREGVAKMYDWAQTIGPQESRFSIPLQIEKNAPPAWLRQEL